MYKDQLTRFTQNVDQLIDRESMAAISSVSMVINEFWDKLEMG